jgi:hypothetical protein
MFHSGQIWRFGNWYYGRVPYWTGAGTYANPQESSGPELPKGLKRYVLDGRQEESQTKARTRQYQAGSSQQPGRGHGTNGCERCGAARSRVHTWSAAGPRPWRNSPTYRSAPSA